VGICLSVNRCQDASLKRLTVHLTEDVALLDVRRSTVELSVVHLPCKVLVQHCVETVEITDV
jgi:hypothetical protein